MTRAYVKAVGPTPPGFHSPTDYAAYRRFRIGDQHLPRICRDCGSVFPDHHCQGAPRAGASETLEVEAS